MAQLAGVPKPIIVQARKKLTQLESQNQEQGVQNDLFAIGSENSFEMDFEQVIEPNMIEQAVRELDPDSLSPKEALDALYQLKKLLS